MNIVAVDMGCVEMGSACGMCKKAGACANSNPQTKRISRRIEIEQLLKGSREIIIVHQGYDYRLQITRNQKLILTK